MTDIMRLENNQGKIFYPETHIDAVIGYQSGGTITPHTHSASDTTSGVFSTARLPSGGVGTAGILALNDTLISSSTTQALTANQGRVLNNKISDVQDMPSSSQWSTTPMQNGWTGSCRYFRSNTNIVHVVLNYVAPNSGVFDTIATLPSGYRPPSYVIGLAIGSHGTFITLVTATGQIQRYQDLIGNIQSGSSGEVYIIFARN